MSLGANDEFAKMARPFRRKIGRPVYYEISLVILLLKPTATVDESGSVE
jgi:hypothetical protein